MGKRKARKTHKPESKTLKAQHMSLSVDAIEIGTAYRANLEHGETTVRIVAKLKNGGFRGIDLGTEELRTVSIDQLLYRADLVFRPDCWFGK